MSTVTGHILTHSGVLVNPINADPDTICIEDIAHSLAMQCRYNGHTERFYSVAEHCVHVSNRVGSESALWGLLHDASEAYLCDIPRPLKPLLANYYELEDKLIRVIAKRFNLPGDIPKSVKLVDNAMLIPERDALMPNASGDWTQLEGAPDLRNIELECWIPQEAKRRFLERFRELT